MKRNSISKALAALSLIAAAAFAGSVQADSASLSIGFAGFCPPARVVGYDDEASPDAIEKRFDRDKADLRAIGVVIEYKADDPTGQAGYVIDSVVVFLQEHSVTYQHISAPATACSSLR